MDQQQAQNLLARFRSGELSEQEKALLESWYLDWEVNEGLDLSEAEVVYELQQMRAGIPYLANGPKVVRLWPRLAAAASILLLLSTGAYFLLHQQPAGQIAQTQAHDIAPGSNKATITLANGKQVAITGAKNGLLAHQGNTAINVQSAEEIAYKTNGSSNELEYNTMATPRGGQHSLILSDGTKVWLDAASSITFPVAFIGNSREVKITGQVYFEVAHDARKPFSVTANGQTVTVLGTHFNINAYTDEAVIKTTLFEGSVKISAGGKQALLKPGQQAQFGHNHIDILKDADTEEALAWHKGKFLFHSADMKTVLRQLSRWYDVDFVYQAQLADRHFSGGIYRSEALKIADILKYEKINFRVEGKKIIIID